MPEIDSFKSDPLTGTPFSCVPAQVMNLGVPRRRYLDSAAFGKSDISTYAPVAEASWERVLPPVRAVA